MFHARPVDTPRQELERAREHVVERFQEWRKAVEAFAALERQLYPHPDKQPAPRKCQGCGDVLPAWRTSFCRDGCERIWRERKAMEKWQATR